MKKEIKRFSDFKLHPQIVESLQQQKYNTPTKIQTEAIPYLLDGRDVIGCAQTGTGKTAAFALPFLSKLAEFVPAVQPHKPKALILVPTRELAEQVGDSFRNYGRSIGASVGIVYGGVKHTRQVKMLKNGIHILVATPGRFQDLYEQGEIKLDQVNFFVLDEADRMLDMGFMPAIEKIIEQLPAKRQMALFSATMPAQITFMAQEIMRNPVEIKVSDARIIAENIDQRVMFVESANKDKLLLELLEGSGMKKTIIFGRTKLAVERVATYLQDAGLKVGIIHGDKFQRDRQKVIKQFAAHELDILFATDVASRGLDIKGISHVINYNVPEDPEDYIHRVGRTARAGKRGIALTLCGRQERKAFTAIERYITMRISVVRSHRFHDYTIEKSNLVKPAKTKNQRSASGDNKKHRKVKKDRTPGGMKLRGEQYKSTREDAPKKMTLSQAKDARKKAKKNNKKQQAIVNRLKKHYKS
jgi:ATP-dependent RNA helicase RhlE